MNEENNLNQEGSSDQQTPVDQPVEQAQPAQENEAAVTEAIPAPPAPPAPPYETAPVEAAPAPAPAQAAPAPAPAPVSYSAPDATQAQPPVQPVQPTEPQQPVASYPQEQPTQAYGTPVQTPDQSQAQQSYPAYGTQQADYSQQAGYYTQPVATQAQPSNGKALAALICGILAILFSATVLIGVILGIVAIVLAGQYVKSFGKDSKATGGKITGIVGIVFSVLALVGYIFLGVWIASVSNAVYDDYKNNTYEYTYSDDDYDYDYDYDSKSEGISGYGDLVDEAGAVAEFDKVMGDVKGLSDDEIIAKIAEEYNDDLKEWYGITLEDMGIDPKEIITLSLGEMTYELDGYSSYSFSDGDELSLEGYVDCVDGFDIMMAFSDELIDNKLYSSDLSDQDMGMIKDLYLNAVKNAESTYEKYVWFELTKNEAGEWTVDPESFEKGVMTIFSIY